MGSVSVKTTEPGPGLVAGRYRTERPVGRGGMGVVWLARDERLGRHVAIKQLGAFPGETDDRTSRAMREARHAAALNHPNVVAVYDVVQHGGAPWLVMEYVDGPTLAQAVRARGALRPRGAADLGAQLAAALVAAHAAGVVHRDIKPANVLIGDRRPKLADFGTARAGADDQLTSTGMVTGTPTYMAPEVADGHEPSEASDLWALGATIYFAVEGHDAYRSQGNPLATLRHIATNPPEPATSAGPLAPVLERLLDRDPARRGSAAQARADLQRVAEGQGVPASSAPTAAMRPVAPPSPPSTSTPPSRASAPPTRSDLRQARPVPVPAHRGAHRSPRRRWVPWLAVGGVLLLLAAGLALLAGRDDGAGGAREGTGALSSSAGGASTAQPAGDAPAFPEDEVRTFVTDHYSRLSSDPRATWRSLTPRMQQAAGGEAAYVELWSGFSSTSASQVEVDEDTGEVSFTLTRDHDGTQTMSGQSITLVREDGALKIDSAG